MQSTKALRSLERRRLRARMFVVAFVAAMIIPNAPMPTVPIALGASAEWTETTTADFADGTFTDTAAAAVGNGAVALAGHPSMGPGPPPPASTSTRPRPQRATRPR
jgi:hypothetical protein